MKRFANNEDVAFGDINLRDAQIRGNHNPGAGGWPTIKYFNKETGYEGKPYPKKTSKSMCDELGDEKYMQAYVEEMGQTSLCSAKTKKGCSEKEAKFVDTWTAKSAADVDAQVKRLEGMAAKPMAAKLKEWLGQRLAILKQFQKAGMKSEL